MQWSRIGFCSIIAAGLLSSGIASAAMVSEYGYSGVQINDIPAGTCMYRSCHSMRHNHHWRHHSCRTSQAFYVCKMYTYEITPQHRYIDCSKWQIEWRRVHLFKS